MCVRDVASMEGIVASAPVSMLPTSPYISYSSSEMESKSPCLDPAADCVDVRATADPNCTGDSAHAENNICNDFNDNEVSGARRDLGHGPPAFCHLCSQRPMMQ